MFKNLKAILSVTIAIAMLSFVVSHKDDIANCIANAIGYTLYDLQATAFGDEWYPPAPQNKVDEISVGIYNFTKKITNGELTVDDINVDDLEKMQRKLEKAAGKIISGDR
jgi:hypothetical protein